MPTIPKTLALILLLFLLSGFIFPLTVTAIRQLAFPHQPNRTLIKQDRKLIP
ncbi:potassium-transporting ATPase subunit C, partial [Staphylococcus capitis]|uniref:potassium-transporting ATPase subunit C n=1 Tax=Staphylococcus capitis TaxID=29388 RepID=UPI00119FA361